MAAKREPARTPALEWIAAAIGLALLLAVTGIIGREAIVMEAARPPAITVQTTRIVPSEGGYIVEFEAVNRANQTAAAVTIEGALGAETSTAMLDYVAGNATATGGLYFKGDPRGQPLTLRALGYQSP